MSCKMNKQKQIEEMAKDIAQATFEATQECLGTECENCRHWIGFSREGCKDCYKAEYLYDLGYRKIPEGSVVLSKEEHKSLVYWEGKFDELIRLATAAACKETAEKFAEMAKKIFKYEAHQQWIDEICKEITGDK